MSDTTVTVEESHDVDAGVPHAETEIVLVEPVPVIVEADTAAIDSRIDELGAHLRQEIAEVDMRNSSAIAQLSEAVNTVAWLVAETAAAVTAVAETETVSEELPEPEPVDSEEIQPEARHWLERKWGGKKK